MNKKGFTIIEMLVAMAVIAIIIMPFIYGFIAISQAYRTHMNAGKVYDELSKVMEIMSNEIRNSDYIETVPNYPDNPALNKLVLVKRNPANNSEIFESFWENSGGEKITFVFSNGAIYQQSQGGTGGTSGSGNAIFSSSGLVSQLTFQDLVGNFDSVSLNHLWGAIVSVNVIDETGILNSEAGFPLTSASGKGQELAAAIGAASVVFLPGKGTEDVISILNSSNKTTFELVAFKGTGIVSIPGSPISFEGSATPEATYGFKKAKITLAATMNNQYIEVSGSFASDMGSRPTNYLWFF